MSGLLVVSPVLAAAAYGLILLARTHPPEAVVCIAITVFFILLACGYYVPYGGGKLGPRFVVPALPFLAVGLGPAFARLPRVTGALAVLSVLPVLALTLVWAPNPPIHNTIWGELARLPVDGGSSRLIRHITPNLVSLTSAGSRWGFGIMVAGASAALLVAFVARPWSRLGLAVAAVAGLALVVGAAQLPAKPPDLQTSISGSATAALPGDEVDFVVTLVNETSRFVPNAVLMIDLPPGMELLGRPAYERGPGCIGTTRLACNLYSLDSHMVTRVRVGVRIAPDAGSRLALRAWCVAGDQVSARSSFSLATGAA
jgi:hypothetical protein